MFEELIKRFPSVDERHLAGLAEVWSIEREKVVDRMLKIADDEIGPVMSFRARPEAIFQLAKLQLWLDARIIEHKTKSASIDSIDVSEERSSLETPMSQQRIENTARICADRIWKRFLDDWSQCFPLVIEHARSEREPKSSFAPRKFSGVKDMHYSPRFSNEYWAAGAGKRIRIYWRGIDERIRSRDPGYRSWGSEPFLYSQKLEHLFGLIEGDASRPYIRLLDMIPLNEHERRCWIAFLLAQLFRTPSFALKFLPIIKDHIEKNNIEFPTVTRDLRRSYETLFINHNLFAEFYRLITSRQWELWRVPLGHKFIRSDDPVLICGSVKHHSWQLVYPMTPDVCFVAGPDHVADPSAVVPTNVALGEIQVQTVNRLIARRARKTVIGAPVADDSMLRILLEGALCSSSQPSKWREQSFPEYWGPIV